MNLDPHNLPEIIDWRESYLNLSKDFSNSRAEIKQLKTTARTLYDSLKRWTDLAADKAPESDLEALKMFDSLMLEMANSTVQ